MVDPARPNGRQRKGKKHRRDPDGAGPASEAISALIRAATQDVHGLRIALDREGLALFKKRPGYGYVLRDSPKHARKVRSPLDDPVFAALAEEVIGHGRTMLQPDRLYTLYEALGNVAAAVEGELNLLEVGVYRGGSAYFLARAASEIAPGRVRLTAVDTFEGHSAADIPEGQEGSHYPSAFSDTDYSEVRSYLEEFDFVRVLKGRIQDSAAMLEDLPIHLAHVDVDIRAPTAFALELVAERAVAGSAIVVDDYGFVTCPGVKTAVDEFVASRSGSYFKITLPTGQCCLVAT